MLDSAVSQNPAAPGEPPEGNKISRSALASIRIVMPIVLLGLATVLCSLLFLLWPAGTPSQPAESSIHAARIFEQTQTEGAMGLIRSLVDVSIYGVVLAGIICLVMAVMGRRGAVLGLMGVGLLGLMYAGGMALYNGPMISVCGFTMILFGGVVAWVASGAADIEPPPPNTPAAETAETHDQVPADSLHAQPIADDSLSPNSEQRTGSELTDTPDWVP